MQGMRFEDYVARLTDDDFEELFSNIEEEEEELREQLAMYSKKELNYIATAMNETFEMPSDDLDVYTFIVELYKCQKADFYVDNLDEFLEDIAQFAEETPDAIEFVDDNEDEDIFKKLILEKIYYKI